jgi:hypothetical protein
VNDEHEWVRRMLAEAGRTPEPMPPDVAARLDRVVQDSVAETTPDPSVMDSSSVRSESPRPDSGVVAMTPRRHRRWAGALLAAAAVTVAGYSVTATGLLDDVRGGTGESRTVGDAAGGDAPASETSGDSAPEAALGVDPTAGVPALSSARLRRDAARLLPTEAERSRSSAQGQGATADAPPGAAEQAGCVPPPAGVRGRRTSVTLDGRPATAVVRAARSGARAVVEVWDCDAPSRLARVVLPR